MCAFSMAELQRLQKTGDEVAEANGTIVRGAACKGTARSSFRVELLCSQEGLFSVIEEAQLLTCTFSL